MKESTFIPIKHISRDGKVFQYGNAKAEMLGHKELPRNVKTMAARMQDVVNALSLPFSVSEANPGAIRHDNGNAFAQAALPDGSTFFIMVRTPIDEKVKLQDIMEQKPAINTFTGICLFSEYSVRAITEEGEVFMLTEPKTVIDKPISQLKVNSHLSPYEIETLIRIPSFMKALLQYVQGADTLYLNIPREEYYFYVLDAYEAGFFSTEQVKTWFGEVDKRHDRIFELMKKRSTINLPKDINTVDITPLAPVREYIVLSVEAGIKPDFQKAVSILRQTSQLWKNVLSIEKPQSWKELGLLSWAAGELSAGLSPDDHPKLGIVVDNPTESKIFAHAKRLVPKLIEMSTDRYNLIGLFVHEMVIPDGKNRHKTMYHIDDSEQTLAQTRVLFQAYRPSRNGG